VKTAFVFSVVVRPHEASFGDRAQPHAILDYLQDAAFLHSIQEGFSVRDLFPRGLTWVMSRYHLEIDREPRVGELISVRTWYTGRSRQFYLRDFAVDREDGLPAVRATSSWLVLDLATRRPWTGGDVLGGMSPLPGRSIDDDFSPLPALEGGGETAEGAWTFHVRPGDVDLNRHVNHVQYVQWALDTAPGGVKDSSRPVSLEVGFRGEAFLGDTVRAYSAPGEDGSLLHRLDRVSDGRELARLRTRWVRRSDQAS